VDKLSILIIDDSEIDRYILSRQLKATNLNLSIIEMSSAEEALSFFSNNEKAKSTCTTPSLIFLDINMPKINGHEFLKEFSKLREKVDATLTQIVMFTSSAQSEDKENSLAYSFVKDYLVKGDYNIEQLEQRIRAFI